MLNAFKTILIGASPILEIRGALPFALKMYGFSFGKAFGLAALGNFLPVIPLLFLWHRLSDFFRQRSYWINRFLSWLFDYTHRRHSHHFSAFGYSEELKGVAKREFLGCLALYVFVAIPFPFTGAWSGTVAAFVFGLPFWKSVLSIFCGILTAGVISALVYFGVISFIFRNP